jgi:uncharacterized protein YcfL
MKKIFPGAVLLSTFLFVGCGSSLRPVVLDPVTKRFPTQTVIADADVKVKKPFDPKFKKRLYIKSEAKSTNTYHTFFVESFKNMGKFDEISSKETLETLIIQKNLSGKVSNVSDLVGLHNLEKEIGPFLIVEPDTQFKGGYNFELDLKAIDPSNGEVVLHIHKAAFNWDGLDQPLFLPVLNGFLAWTEEAPKAEPKVETKAPQPAQPAAEPGANPSK